jgi:hypothetical protein
MRLPSALLVAGVCVFAAMNVGSTLGRSTIPYAIHGDIEGIEVRFEKHRGVDDVYLVTVGGRTLHVDRAVGVRLTRGEHVDKESWSTSLRTDDGTVRLRPSADVRRMAAVMPLVVLGASSLVLAGFDRRRVRE